MLGKDLRGESESQRNTRRETRIFHHGCSGPNQIRVLTGPVRAENGDEPFVKETGYLMWDGISQERKKSGSRT